MKKSNFLVDHYSFQGSTHKCNQDYALSGFKSGPYCIVCDGCSSVDHSEISSMILAHTTQSMLDTPDFSPENIMLVARRTVFGEQKTKLYSTLMYIREDVDWLFDCTIIGDGYLGVEHDCGTQLVYKVDYDNAPFYPPHLNQEHKFPVIYENGHEVIRKSGTHITRFQFPQDHIKSIFIASDGLVKFYNKGQNINYMDLAHEIFNIRTPAKGFLERRCRRILQNYNKGGFRNLDDFTVAMICNPQQF